jgi:porphobilinogen synthase
VQTPPPFPASRPRRLRRHAWSRDLVRESDLDASDLILPVFVLEGEGKTQDIASMPGVQRVSLDRLYPIAEECVARGIPVLALFPVLEPSLKSEDGREALNARGLVPTVVRELKKRFPELGLMTDVALDPYTSHGQMACSTRPATSSTTPRSRSWRSRRWCRPRPASTSSRPAT